jgi:hypothetical protein
MSTWKVIVKKPNETLRKIQAQTKEEALEIAAQLKRMDMETFLKLYDVVKDTSPYPENRGK